MKIRIYLAAGWFDEYQLSALKYIEDVLEKNDKLDVYSPLRVNKMVNNPTLIEQKDTFDSNIRAIKMSDFIIASTVGKDMGTLWECGFACAHKIPVIYTCFDPRLDNFKFNLMLAQSGLTMFSDKAKFERYISLIETANDFYDLANQNEFLFNGVVE